MIAPYFVYPTRITSPVHLPRFLSFDTLDLPSEDNNMESNKLYDLVQSRYGDLASRSSTKEHTTVEENVAKAFGYEASELSSIPKDANLGVSCGNPLALANLREVTFNMPSTTRSCVLSCVQGETVIDLGSGGGIDVLLAARKVGSTGKAIGVDMTTVRNLTNPSSLYHTIRAKPTPK